MSINRGKFIVLEGIEGSGKTTQTELLYQHLLSKNIKVHKTKEATNGPIGKILHHEYLSGKRKVDGRLINILYVADRLDHITNADDGILNIINNGTTVICDRYYLSSAAYHSSFFFDDSDKRRNAMIDIINQNKVNRDLLKPDITILIDVLPDIALKRVMSRNQPKEIFDDYNTLEKLRICYDSAARYLSDMGDDIIKISSNLSIDDCHNDIVGIVDGVLNMEGV